MDLSEKTKNAKFEHPISFEMRPRTRRLVDALLKVEVDGMLTYLAMSELLGEPVNGGLTALQSARRHVHHKYGMVFDCTRTLGYQRLRDTAIVASGQRDNRLLRGRARRNARKLGSVQDFGAMPNGVQLQHTLLMTVNNVVLGMTRAKSLGKIAEAVQANAPSAALTIAAMLKSMGMK